MDQSQDIEELERASYSGQAGEPESVDDFIRQLEAREKDLHITLETNVIEIAESFDDANPQDFLKEGLAETKIPTPPPANLAADGSEFKRLAAKVEKLNETVKRLESEKAELYEAAQRRQKDLDNFRSRVERERGDTFQNQLGNLAAKMLPALDNLNRAVDFALAMPDDHTAESRQFIDGIILVNQQLEEVFAAMGVRPIASVGEPFDPHFHEAVAVESSELYPDGAVFEEVLRGYSIGGRVIRASMVKVVKNACVDLASESDPEDAGARSAETETDDELVDNPE
jgi:molecular chaperone GrpE